MKPIAVVKKATRLKDIFMTAAKRLSKVAAVWPLALLVAAIAQSGPICTNLGAQEIELVDRIVAVVNNEIITLYDLNRRFEPYVNNIKKLNYTPEKERQTLFKVRQDILDQLINSRLADQQVKRDGIAVTQNEIDSAIERVKESRQLTDEQLRLGLASQGMTMEEYRKEIEEQILRTKLVNREVKAKIVITKEDIKEYYESHREKYTGQKKYYLWNMYVKVPPDSGSLEKTNARDEIEAMALKLRQGHSFSSVVDELKMSSLAVRGTDLGFFRLEELSEQLRQVVKEMDAGQFSAVLETNFGYQIVYIDKIEESQAKPIEAVEPEIEELLYKEMVDNKYQEWLDQLRTRSHIRIIN